MEIIGPIKCTIIFGYITESPKLNFSEIVSKKGHLKIKNEFNFSEMEVEIQISDQKIKFENGEYSINGEEYVIDELDIERQGFHFISWGETKDLLIIKNKIHEILNESSPSINLDSLRNEINITCETQVKFDFDFYKIFDKKFINILNNYKNSMKMSDNSIIDVVFPSVMIMYNSTPDVQKIISSTPEKMQLEMNLATGPKFINFNFTSAENVRNKIARVTAQADSDTLKKILENLEKL